MSHSAHSSSSVLDALLVSELASAASQSVTIHAGHYALFSDRQSGVSDYLHDLDTEGAELGIVDLCRATWEAACRSVATALPQTKAQLMVLVNDWQFVSRNQELRRENEQAASRMREQYYLATPTLSDYHLNEMDRHGLPTDLILRCREDQWLFSESALRNELNPLIHEVLEDEQRAVTCGIRKHYTENGEPIIDVCDDESGKVRLLYCGNTNCAGEVVSLLGNLFARGVRRFLNIYPAQCREPVSAGTRLAYRLFRLDGFVVTNVAVSRATRDGTTLHASVERFDSEAVSLINR